MKAWDVVIVGGGLAGYTAALFLIEEKKSVLLVEQAKSVGGRARTEIKEGQLFNLGPHALYKKGKAPAILEELGIRIQGKSPNLNGLLLEKNKTHALPLSLSGIFSTSYLTWKEKIAWASFIIKTYKVNVSTISHISFQQWLEERVKSTNVQQLVYAMARLTTYSHAPDQTDAAVILNHIQRSLGGAIYVDGGWQSVVDQLNNYSVMAGVRIQKEAKVKHISLQEKGLYAVQFSKGQTFRAKNIIYTGKPDTLPDILSDDFPRKSNYNKMNPITAAILDIALTDLPKPKNLFALSVDEALYFSVHSPYAKLSIDGKSVVVHVMKYHHPNEKINQERAKIELESLLDRLQPGWRSFLIASRYLPQVLVNQRLPRPDGINIIKQAETNLPGFYTAGDWASPDSILAEGALISGKQAAFKVLQKGSNDANKQ